LPQAFHYLDDSTGIGGVYLTQILPFVDEKALAVFYDFETALYETI
jgi:methyl acetate hydrolase